MKIRFTKNDSFEFIIFTWNDELTECDYVVAGVEHEEAERLIEEMIEGKHHEGRAFEGWTMDLDLCL